MATSTLASSGANGDSACNTSENGAPGQAAKSLTGQTISTPAALTPDGEKEQQRLQALARKRGQARLRQIRKRERDKASQENVETSCYLGIATTCLPKKYPPLNTPEGTAFQQVVEYIQNLQLNDCIARPEGWPEILHQRSSVKEQVQFPLQHPWQRLRSNHYCIAATHQELEQRLNSGLCLPVLITPKSTLGQEITTQCSWFNQSIETLLDEIFKDKRALIQVQDHAKASINAFTVNKTCEEVRNRFRIDPQNRGCPWNCLEIDDRLPGPKGPKCLAGGGRIRDWQFTNPNEMDMSRPKWSTFPGAKKVDQWLLVTESQAGSTGHLDVCYATWISCLVGKKSFWVRNNPTAMDQVVWDNFDIADDHRRFEEPWARIDLYPGYTMAFPPGTIHAVWTDEDTVCCGGHFLVPQVMDRFVDVLRQTELDPSRTNDVKGADFFRLLENFILEALSLSSAGLMRAQLERFVLSLEKYINQKFDTEDRTEAAHMNRRKKFLKRLREQGWVQRLKDKAKQMSW